MPAFEGTLASAAVPLNIVFLFPVLPEHCFLFVCFFVVVGAVALKIVGLFDCFIVGAPFAVCPQHC